MRLTSRHSTETIVTICINIYQQVLTSYSFSSLQVTSLLRPAYLIS